MANIKISELNELTTKEYTDYIPIVDTSADETKKISVENLIPSNVNLIAVSDTAPETYETGDKYFNTEISKIYTATSSGWANAEDPILNILYIVLEEQKSYTYDGITLISVGGGAGGGGETLPVGSEIDFTGNASDIPIGWEQIDSYSTDEVNTGKVWVDNRPIYRKVITATPSATMQWSTLDDSAISNLRSITSMQAMYGGYLPVPCFVTAEYYVALQYATGTGVQAYIAGYPVAQISVIVEYTKTTD